VTSKDSPTIDRSSTTKSVPIQPSITTEVKRDLTEGITLTNNKFRYYHNGFGPTVTTHISAARNASDFSEEDEISRIEMGLKSKKDGVPLGVIWNPYWACERGLH
jgi:hypothetical protein